MTTLHKPVRRITREPFFRYGPDRDRRFVAALMPGDVLTLRPVRSRAGGTAEITIKLVDVYRYALQCRENMRRLEKANKVLARVREAKAKSAERRALAKLDRQIWRVAP